MKHSAIILAAVVLTGCTLDNRHDFDVDYAIEFQPAMYMHSAPSDTESYPEGQDFGVSVWVLPDGYCWDEDSEKAEDYALACCIACEGDGSWTMTDMLWPAKYERLTFIAYSPFEEASGCDRTDGVLWTDVDIMEDQTDLLYTDPLADMSKTECGGVVTLPFRHAMCLVDFRVKNRVEKGEKIVVKKITIDAVRNRGEFRSLMEPAWNLEDSMVPVVFYEGRYDTGWLPEPIGSEWLFLPQELDTNVAVEYEYVHSTGSKLFMDLKTVPLKTVLEAGKRYTFTLSVGIDDVRFLEELIEDRIR